jgi:hypothetical protein
MTKMLPDSSTEPKFLPLGLLRPHLACNRLPSRILHLFPNVWNTEAAETTAHPASGTACWTVAPSEITVGWGWETVRTREGGQK